MTKLTNHTKFQMTPEILANLLENQKLDRDAFLAGAAAELTDTDTNPQTLIAEIQAILPLFDIATAVFYTSDLEGRDWFFTIETFADETHVFWVARFELDSI